MINTHKLSEIYSFVRYVHGNQFRDDDSYYLNHLTWVADSSSQFMGVHNKYYSFEQYLYASAVGYLHDFFEDCPHHLLQHIELDDFILENMRILTNDKHKSLEERTLEFGRIAVVVKVFDRIHNLQSCVGVWKPSRIRKYLDKSYSFLEALKKRNQDFFPEQELLLLFQWQLDVAELALAKINLENSVK
jgi:(p)ppGpp synthase/HD superfamily hydrolase